VVQRVAIVTESFLPLINGVTGSVVRVLETLKQRELEAIVIAPTSQSQKHLGFEVRTTPSLSLLQFPVAVPSPAVSKILDDFSPDVLHVAAPFLLGAQALSWGQKSGTASVAVYQTDVSGYLERYNLRYAKPVMDRIVAKIHSLATLNLAPSRQSANYLADLGVGDVAIWGRGVDRDLFSPRLRSEPEALQLRNELAPGAEFVVGFVGRLAQEKQVDRMAELFGLPGVSFVVVGDGPERERLEQMFAGYPVTFTGALTGVELARAYATFDVFTHFGTEETFGQTIQEAKSMGLAVVAPDSGGPRELIQHGRTGLLVDHTKAGAYREAVESLLAKERREAIGIRAIESVQDKSWRDNNDQLLRHYQTAYSKLHAMRAEQLELA
jgi:phosphatidylinositol alpha 1,6-mannosyltransferase